MTSQAVERTWIPTGSSGANGLMSLRNTCTFPNKSTPVCHHYLGKRITPGLNLNTKNLKFRKSVFDYLLKHVKGNQDIYLQDIHVRVLLKKPQVHFSFRDA